MILETAVRCVVLAGLAGLILSVLRVRSAALKLAVWRLVLLACLLMPFVPRVPVNVPVSVAVSTPPVVTPVKLPTVQPTPSPTVGPSLLLQGYWIVSGLLLLRAAAGLVRIHRLTRKPIAIAPDVFESEQVRVPVTCGLLNGRILLPKDWTEWSDETLHAVLAHERSHIAQRDFLTQLLSRVNCALNWINPLSWWLHSRLVALAEEVSDDAALTQVSERPSYAALLLGFASRGERLAAGVAMARQTPVASRIERILDEARSLSRPVGLRSHLTLAAAVFAAMFLIGACHLTTVSAQTKVEQRKIEQKKRRNGVYTWSNSDEAGWMVFHGDGHVLSFEHRGQEYLIDDPATLKQVDEWMRPQEELGRQQGELGEQQGKLGEEMSALGDQMGQLGDQISSVKVNMPKLSDELKRLHSEVAKMEKLQVSVSELGELQAKLADLQAKLGDVQGKAGDTQAHIGERQAELGAQQAKLGEQQAKLGEQQAKLGEQQEQAAKELELKMEKLFDEAIKDGRAKVVK